MKIIVGLIAYDLARGVDAFNETFPTIANIQAKSEDITLPEEYVGVVMVFRTFNKVSYGLSYGDTRSCACFRYGKKFISKSSLFFLS